MKIRIKGNSIRLRLTKTEVECFGKNGLIEERTDFGNGALFHYRLEKRGDIKNLSATFANHTITVTMPEAMADEWTGSDAVGFEQRVDTGNGNELLLLVEKDFVCLDRTFEDQSDNYPHPSQVC